MPFNGAEFAWNSVDVRGNDGLLHNGRVIDAVDEGLLVDFGGTGDSGTKLIPLGNVYYRNLTNYVAQIEEHAVQMEVLLRLQPQDPWKWYPCMALNAFGLVNVTLPERELKGFVVGQRLRITCAFELACMEVLEGQFSTKRVVVPSEHTVVLPEDDQLIAMFNDYCRKHEHMMMAIEVVKHGHDGIFKELVVLGIFDCDDDDRPYVPLQDWKECSLPLDNLLLELLKNGAASVDNLHFHSASTPVPDGNIQTLFRDPTIFPEIFECLTTIQQIKMRRVCATWDIILTSPHIRRVVTVTCPSGGPDFTNKVYEFAACLYNCWTQLTRVLVLDGPPSRPDVHLARTARLLHQIRAEKGLPVIETVILCKEWTYYAGERNWVNELCGTFVSLGGVFKRFLLRDVGLYMGLGSTRKYFGSFEIIS